MRLLWSALLVLLCLSGVMAQSGPATCGNVPVDVSFKPSNCLESGGESTLETVRFRGVGIVNLFIAGQNGRIGSGDRGVRVDGDGVLRLRIDTTDFFGSQIPAGDYSVIIKDVTGRLSPMIVPFTVTGDSVPVVPTARATTTPELPGDTPTASRTLVPGGTPTTTRTSLPSGTPTTTRTSLPAGTPTATRTSLPAGTPTATATLPTIDAASLCRQIPNPGQATNLPIRIADIDEVQEIVVLENVSDETVNLDGWIICSIRGGQVHTELFGDIESRVSADIYSSDVGEIWDDVVEDDGALYDAAGRLISYFEDID